MRKLYHVPVIHVSADLGAVAPAVDRKSAEICGKKRWGKHKQSVLKYWDGLDEFFKRMDARNLKIYQDGLMAGGELGRRIIEEGAGRGSRNHEIVLDLIQRGAQLRKTEDAGLLKQEYEQILEMAQQSSAWERTVAPVGGEFGRDRLLKKRDRFIAETINETLLADETGVLFMGAFHDVISQLTPDIEIEAIKQREKVAAYFRCLISGGDEKTFDRLAAYLTRPPMIND